MCYHASSPELERLIEYTEDYELIINSYEPYYHANGFAHPAMPILTMTEPHIIQPYMWGLVPIYAKDRKDAQEWSNRMLNATCEKAGSTYKPYFQKQGCLIFTDGFFEWKWKDAAGKEKIPYFISTTDKKPFTLGGIYNHWTDPESGIAYGSYSIMTTPANSLMTVIHNSKKRMRLIIAKEQWAEWLDPGKLPTEMLVPFPDGLLQAHEVSRNITKRGFDTNVKEIQERVK